MSENSTNGPQEPQPKAAAIAAEVEELERKSASAARLFDVRRIIGGLFVVYGLIVGGAGITADHAELQKAQGININLWTGIAMLVLGVFFLVWLQLRPTVTEPSPEEDGQESGQADA